MRIKSRRYLYLVSAAITMLFAGVTYAWSILKAPYLYEFGWSQGELGLNFTITMSCFCLGGILGGVLIKKLPLWLLMNLAGVLVCIGLWLCGSLSGDALWKLYLSYGLLCGFGIGIIYNVVISSIMGWFPDKRATVSGILMMAFGFSSLLFSFITSALMSSLGWRAAFYCLGLCILLVFAICSCILRVPEANCVKIKQKNPGTEFNYTPWEMLRLSSFWRFYIFTILIVSIGVCVISLAKDIALSVGAGETLAILLTGAVSVCNGLGRVLAGTLFDKVGGTNTIRIANMLSVSAMLLMLGAALTKHLALLVPGIILVGFSYGCMPPITSGFIGKAYGVSHFSVNFGIANTMLFFSSFSATVGGWLYGLTGGYTAVFILLLLFAVLSSIIGESLGQS